jgi:predicted nucleic acid-binding protein
VPPARFIDSNVFLRYLLNDDPPRSVASLALLERIDRGVEKAITSTLVLFEVIFTLQRVTGHPKAVVRDLIRYILEIQNLELSDRDQIREALDIYVDNNISFGDGFNVVSMRSAGVSELYSWDREYDRVLGIIRREPT